MIIATFNSSTGWAGKTITWNDGVFTLEDHGPITAAGVMGYDQQGQLDWPYDGMREWLYGIAASQGAGIPARADSPSVTSEPRRRRRKSKPEEPALTSTEVPTADDFEALLRGMLRGAQPPKRLDRMRIFKAVDECQSEATLRHFRSGADAIFRVQGGYRSDGWSLEDRPPTAAEVWIADLADHINVRLRAFRVRPVKPPPIVGEMHHQEALARVFNMTEAASDTKTRAATLVPEPGNQYDTNAVAVLVRGELIGYLKRDVAAAYSPALQRTGKPLKCRVRLARQGGSEGIILAFFEDALPPPSSLV